MTLLRLIPQLGAVGLFALAPALSGQFAPAPYSPFPAGTGPAAIAVADFDLDGNSDIAIANRLGASVTILLGNGAGGFQVPPIQISLPSNSEPSAIAAADLNGDAYPDLVVADAANHAILVVLGGKGAAFSSTPVSYSTGNGPGSITLGHFNTAVIKNGVDVAAANLNDGTVTVLFGDGTGKFATSQCYTTVQTGETTPWGCTYPGGTLLTPTPSSIAAGNFFVNLLQPSPPPMDLVVVNEISDVNNHVNGTISVFRNTGVSGNSQFALSPRSPMPLPPGTNPCFVAAADVNSDGFEDLVIASINSNNITVLLGNGLGDFIEAPGSPFAANAVGPFSITIHDFNGDFIPDLAIANAGSNSVTVMTGKATATGSGIGTGAFTAVSGSPFTVGAGPSGLVVGAFNGDGAPDLVAANLDESDVTLLLNTFAIAPTMMSSATEASGAVAPDSLVTIFGVGLADAPIAGTTPAADSMGGTSVYLTDASGAIDQLTLLWAGPSQINALLPPYTAPGAATFSVSTASGFQAGTATVTDFAPGLFSADMSGSGLGAGFVTQTLNGSVMQTMLASGCVMLRVPLKGQCTPAAIDASVPNTTLTLLGTGIRNRPPSSTVTVVVDGQALSGANTGPYFIKDEAGTMVDSMMDQVTVGLTSSLAGLGMVDVTLQIGGANAGATATTATSNTVTICLTGENNSPALCTANQ